jgi:hypothetical protein
MEDDGRRVVDRHPVRRDAEMHTTHGHRRLGGAGAALAVLVAVVAACGGASNTSTPKGTMEQALRLVADKDTDGLTALACEAQKDTVAEQFDFAGGLTDSLGVDVDPDRILDAIEIDVSKVAVAETNVSGDTATVQLTGAMSMVVDEEAFKDVIREVAEQQGTPIDDAQLDALMGMIGSFAQDIPMNETVDLVRENGAWKICD